MNNGETLFIALVKNKLGIFNKMGKINTAVVCFGEDLIALKFT